MAALCAPAFCLHKNTGDVGGLISLPSPRHIFHVVLTLALGTLGSLIYGSLGLPLPWLLGALLAVFIAAILPAPLNLPLTPPGPMMPVMRTILGLAIGSAFTPQLLSQLHIIGGSLLMIGPYLFLLGGLGYYYFTRFGKMDRSTAYFSAMPGGINDMIAMAGDSGGNERTVSLIHSTRILVLVFLLPFLVAWFTGTPAGGGRPFNFILTMPPLAECAVLIFAAALGWWGAKKLGLFGAPIIGPMIVIAVLHVADISQAKPPLWLVSVAQIVLGVQIGCKYIGLTKAEFFKTVLVASIYAILLIVLAAFYADGVSLLLGVDKLAALLAFAPGGQAEMTLIGLFLGADIAYVALHHLIRVALVLIGAQIIFRWMNRND